MTFLEHSSVGGGGEGGGGGGEDEGSGYNVAAENSLARFRLASIESILLERKWKRCLSSLVLMIIFIASSSLRKKLAKIVTLAF